MRRLVAFMNITLDGYLADPRAELDWAYRASSDQEREKACRRERQVRRHATILSIRPTR
jgi:hypothetical protein